MTQYEFTGGNLAEAIHKATTGRADGPDLARCENLVGLIRALRCQQKDIYEREIPDLNRQISSRQADIRQLEADRPRLDLSPPSIPKGGSRRRAIATAIANAIAAAILGENQAKNRRIDAQIESIKGKIEGLKSEIVDQQNKRRELDFQIGQHFRERDQRGCPHVDMAFFVC